MGFCGGGVFLGRGRLFVCFNIDEGLELSSNNSTFYNEMTPGKCIYFKNNLLSLCKELLDVLH